MRPVASCGYQITDSDRFPGTMTFECPACAMLLVYTDILEDDGVRMVLLPVLDASPKAP